MMRGNIKIWMIRKRKKPVYSYEKNNRKAFNHEKR
jgi:hypothetical protein